MTALYSQHTCKEEAFKPMTWLVRWKLTQAIYFISVSVSLTHHMHRHDAIWWHCFLHPPVMQDVFSSVAEQRRYVQFYDWFYYVRSSNTLLVLLNISINILHYTPTIEGNYMIYKSAVWWITNSLSVKRTL